MNRTKSKIHASAPTKPNFTAIPEISILPRSSTRKAGSASPNAWRGDWFEVPHMDHQKLRCSTHAQKTACKVYIYIITYCIHICIYMIYVSNYIYKFSLAIFWLQVLASADDNKAGRRAPTIAALATTAPVPRETNFNTNCVTWEILIR